MVDITLDFEAYYDQEYSLRNLTTREYIMDPRFEPILLGVRQGEERFTLEKPDIADWVRSVDWSRVRMSAHNAMFDGAILAWRYGAVPKLYECSMSMAQALIGHSVGSSSLAAVNEFFGIHKDSEALMNMKGMRYDDMDRQSPEWRRYKTYCMDDVDHCHAHTNKFRGMLSGKQRLVIDILIRQMFIQSQLVLDHDMLVENLRIAKAERERVLGDAGVTDVKQIRSRDQFATLLESHGVTPPTKISPTTGKLTYAFAKKDLDFVELQTHHDEKVRMLVEAKLNASSSLEETRTQRFIELSGIGDGTLNVPLKYSGAHTHRFSGQDSINLQNLPRKSQLRHAIRAAKGRKLVVVDASQIEARILAWAAGCMELVAKFDRGVDVYADFASKLYGYPINKQDNPEERFLGKTGILGLGYATGGVTLQLTLARDKVIKDIDFCRDAVNTYRREYKEIPELWKIMDQMIEIMANGGRQKLGPVLFTDKRWISPSGLPVVYPKLHRHEETDYETGRTNREYRYWRHRYKSWTNLYGGKLTENYIQHLAWLQIVDTMVKMRLTNPDWICALQVHDELVYSAPEDEAQDCYEHLMKFMCEQPDWASVKSYPIPLAAEGGVAETYGDAK